MSVTGAVPPLSANVLVVVRLATLTVPVNVGEADSTTDPLPVEVVTPVPPLATASVPDIVMVPLLVTGPPENDNPVVPPETCTEVTVPAVVHVGVAPGPAEVKT